MAEMNRRHRPTDAAMMVLPSFTSLVLREGTGSFAVVATTLAAAHFAGLSPHEGLSFAVGVLAVPAGYLAALAVVGSVSGAHFNPAVTLSLAFAGRVPFRVCAAYVPAQLLGAWAAAVVAVTVTGSGDGVRMGWAENSPTRSPAPVVFLLSFAAAFVLSAVYCRRGRAAPRGDVASVAATLFCVSVLTVPIVNGPANPAHALATLWGASDSAVWQVWAVIIGEVCGAVVLGTTVFVGDRVQAVKWRLTRLGGAARARGWRLG